MRNSTRARDALWRRVGYAPSPEQLAAHASDARIRLIAGGERAGKSRSAAMELVGRFLGGRLYWLVGPDYELCRPEFEYLVEAFARLDAIEKLSFPVTNQCRLTLRTGARVVTRSARDPARLAGEAPDGILACEAAQIPYEAFLRLRGRVAERRGWLWLSGTFESSLGWYAEKYAAWQGPNRDNAASFSMPTWANRALYPSGRSDPEIRALEATYPLAAFRERFGGVPCPPATIVFTEFQVSRHVRSVEAAAVGAVEIAVDPGYAGAYAVLALVRTPDGVAVVDEVYARHAVAASVIAECRRRPWWARVIGGVIDIAGRQHHGAASQIEIWQSLAGLRLRSRPVGVRDGIDRLRTFLQDPATGQPRIAVDPRCRALIEEFGRYRYHGEIDGRPISEEPIDRDNHAIKALAYWLYDRFGPVARPARRYRDFAVLR